MNRQPMHVSEILKRMVAMADNQKWNELMDENERLSRLLPDLVDDEDWDRLREVQEERDRLSDAAELVYQSEANRLDGQDGGK